MCRAIVGSQTSYDMYPPPPPHMTCILLLCAGQLWAVKLPHGIKGLGILKSPLYSVSSSSHDMYPPPQRMLHRFLKSPLQRLYIGNLLGH